MPFWKVTSTGRPSSTGRIEANALVFSDRMPCHAAHSKPRASYCLHGRMELSQAPETCARTGADRRTDFVAKGHRDGPDGTRSGPFPLVLFSYSEGNTACAVP